VLAFGVAMWSVATFLTPPASISFGLLLAIRVLLGLGEGVNFPAIHSIAARWTLAAERSRAIALNFSGIYLGSIVAFLASPAIILAFGWHALFYISGAVGVIWVFLWLWRTSETPEQCAGITRDELATIIAGRPEAPRADAIPWGKIARQPAVWAIALAHFCSNFGFNILLLWLPTYLDKTFSVPLAKLGHFSLIPWVATFVVANGAGWIADAMRRANFRVVIIGVAATGFILRATGSFSAVFYLIASIYLAGAIGYAMLAAGDQKI
jgi:MFS family permease